MKKTIIIITIVVFLIIAGISSVVIYNKIYTAKVSEEIKKLGLNPEEYNLPENASLEEIRHSITAQEVNKILSEMGISPNEIDLSGLDFTNLNPGEIYDLVYGEVTKQKNQKTMDVSKEIDLMQSSDTSSTAYNCVDDTESTNRGYILIHGAGGPDANEVVVKNAVSTDPHHGGFLYFTYDANEETLDIIATRFISEYKTFASQGYDKIIIYGQSAGGVIASRVASDLGTAPDIEIHTLASPLNGYKFGPATEQIAQQFSGFNKEIVVGFDSYTKPPSNVIVYHHKTVEDETLRSFCGNYKSLCSPDVIQNNNILGSYIHMYPDDTHESITTTVVTKSLSCVR